MGEIHELFVLALSLVWFAGATPDKRGPVPVAGPSIPLTGALIDCQIVSHSPQVLIA